MNSELAELGDYLLAHPDVVTYILLSENGRDRRQAVARYLAASTTIKSLSLFHNQLGPATLRINRSLQFLYLFNNEAVDRTRIDAAFM